MSVPRTPYLFALCAAGTQGEFMYALVVTGNLNQPARYLTWGPLQISVANLLVIVIMLALFAAALLLPFPKDRKRS